ncbi:MAG: hypothetical protein HGB35_07705, partial [Geobacteraceae bacterium]|nr:hypothetical protein [Geobacteraceae bacterium]
AYTASFVSTNYVRNCRKCHNPHNTTSDIEYNRAWANSGHGEVNVGARTSRDFKLYGTAQPANLAYTNSSPSATTDPAVIATGTPVCVRCHTTTGYINFVNSGFMSLKPFGSNTDKTKEVTGCDACHSDYSFKMRVVPRVTIYFNFSGATQASAGNPGGHAKIQNYGVTFPALGSSNMCIPCHSGRGVGSSIKLLSDIGVDFSKINSPSAHDFSGAALLTAKSGYEFAGKEYTTGVGANTGHDSAGLSSGKGPCITCHLNKAVKSDSHTFKPVIHDTAQFPLYSATKTWSQTYSVSSASPASLKISSITSLSCNTSGCHVGLGAAELNSDKEGYISALAVLNQWARLVQRTLVNAPGSLICVDDTNPPRLLTKWNYYGTGPDLMGAAFNLSMLNNEPGAYVHNPLYAKRLVYDSIAYLMQAESKTSVAEAIQSLVGNTRVYYTVIASKTRDPLGNTLPEPALTAAFNKCANYTTSTVAITSEQADAAIKWLYGSSTPLDTSKRPGDN